MWEGIAAGFAVVAFNGLAAWGALRWSWGRSFQIFSLVFLGGMFLRIVLVAAVSVSLFKFTQISKGAYAGSLIFFIILFLVLEISWLLKRAKMEKEGVRGDVSEKKEKK